MTAFAAGFVAISLAVATVARAQEISLNRPGSGARAAGMGNAFIAVADDGTAASWNPAGLSQLRKAEFSLVYSASRRNQFLEGLRTLDRSAVFTALKTSSTAANLEFASAALPFTVAGRPITVQVGWRRLYEFSAEVQGDITRIPISAGGRPESLLRLDNSSDGSIRLWTAAGAVRLTNRLSLGLSTDFYSGRWDDRGNISETPGTVGATDFVSVRSSNGIGGHTVNLGLLLTYPSVRVGLVYHGALRTGYEATQSQRSSLTEPIDAHYGRNAGITLHFPRSLGLGLAWLPRPLLRLALDLTYDEWTKFLIEGAPNSGNHPLSGFDGLPPELSATRNTVTVNAGLERLFLVEGRYLPIRLGFSHEPQGGRDPVLREDVNQKVVAAGTGLNSNNLKFDVALEYRWGRFRHTLNLSPVYQVGPAEELGLPLPPEAEGATRFQDFRLKVSVIYRITNAAQIGNALRKAFGS
jgi:long-subunit fatty acid transport protein